MPDARCRRVPTRRLGPWPNVTHLCVYHRQAKLRSTRLLRGDETQLDLANVASTRRCANSGGHRLVALAPLVFDSRTTGWSATIAPSAATKLVVAALSKAEIGDTLRGQTILSIPP
ncbi:MAG TPA: hypothetical protein VHQ21_17605 [Rhodanobacteraceae bacterium]|nr:hypothetical protein [Rhodanobacteraceae bacterium]